MKFATSSTIPTSGQCRGHLKLLEALHLLREDVATTDGLYGIYDRFVDDVYPGKGLDEQRAQLLLKLREKRWAIYVTNAERRYTIWFRNLPSARRSMPGQQALAAMSVHFEETSGKPGFAFASVTLPPLDVLMVWHAHLLNPHDFLEDCIRYDKKLVWDTGLPLPIINQCIDNETFEYRTSENAPDEFRRNTGLRWDPLDDDQQPILNCLKCAQAKQVVWTTLTTADFWREPNYRDRGSGLADPEFAMSCDRCFTTSTHEALRVQKFQKDRKALLEKDLPMPGTYLNTKGRLQPIVNLSSHAPFFPNNLLKTFRSPRFEKLDKPGTSMDDVRKIIEEGIQDLPTRGLRSEKLAVRKMMSRYWSNSSIFALDLVGAVIRQGTFIEKMHAIDWLHSPAVQSTMNRLLTKYGRYFTILKLNRGKTAVPTLDVDLAWHTHQLCPGTYYRYSVLQTDRFIDHDDKIPAPTLSTAFEWTSKTYQSMFHEMYSECTCWYCEAVRESHTSAASRHLFHRRMHKDIESRLSVLDHTNAENERPMAHISAHNAVDCPTDAKIVAAGLAKKEKLDAMYEKACKRAEKNGTREKMLDRRDERSSAAAAGGIAPMYVPYYVPYTADPCITATLYPSNPACASFEAGAAGNCCQGTCGGGVAAGGCLGGGDGGGGGGSGDGGGSGGGGGCGGGGG